MKLMSVKIYHNPRCSKSRQTLQLLEDNGVQAEVIQYLKTPPTAAELDKILTLLDIQPRELMRTKEAEYKATGMDNPDLDRNALIAGMVNTPKLIERPIVLANGKAVIGRPPESVLEIL
ncbi:arsenate reductase [Bathymodiolus platifrons methanotrophic gill symbiont]|nr:arsenate reductase [Bathymodiolus platifrons methanotrophic gill symbiont]